MPSTHTPSHYPGHRMPQQRLKKGPAPPMRVACPSASRSRDGSPHTSPERRSRSLCLGAPTCGPPRADDTSLTSGRRDHVAPGPPANDPSGDMDCSEDHEGARTVLSEKARAAMPPTTDVVAPHEHPALSERAANHGLDRHVRADGDSEALSPCPTPPI